MTDQDATAEIRSKVYEQRRLAHHLRQEVFQQADPSQSAALLAELADAETRLSAAEAQLSKAIAADPAAGTVTSTSSGSAGGGLDDTLGAETTGLQTQVSLRMAQVPTSIYHLLDPQVNPLVSCLVKNCSTGSTIRRVRVSTYIDGYSAKAVSCFELPPNAEIPFDHLPTLFPDRTSTVNEITRATLNLLVEDLDNNKVEIHETYPIWLLARTAALFRVRDPKTGQWNDFTPYFGAFVTPNAPAVMSFLRKAASHHPNGRLVGYQGDRSSVEPQVKAIFEALKAEADITYVNSLISFNPEEGASSQRVRRPTESLADHQANCIDGTVLFASLLEAASLSPAIVLIPGHAFVAWETWGDQPDDWRYVETTMIGSNTYEEASASAAKLAEHYQNVAKTTGNPLNFRRWPLRELRAKRGILPME